MLSFRRTKKNRSEIKNGSQRAKIGKQKATRLPQSCAPAYRKQAKCHHQFRSHRSFEVAAMGKFLS